MRPGGVRQSSTPLGVRLRGCAALDDRALRVEAEEDAAGGLPAPVLDGHVLGGGVDVAEAAAEDGRLEDAGRAGEAVERVYRGGAVLGGREAGEPDVSTLLRRRCLAAADRFPELADLLVPIAARRADECLSAGD